MTCSLMNRKPWRTVSLPICVCSVRIHPIPKTFVCRLRNISDELFSPEWIQHCFPFWLSVVSFTSYCKWDRSFMASVSRHFNWSLNLEKSAARSSRCSLVAEIISWTESFRSSTVRLNDVCCTLNENFLRFESIVFGLGRVFIHTSISWKGIIIEQALITDVSSEKHRPWTKSRY